MILNSCTTTREEADKKKKKREEEGVARAAIADTGEALKGKSQVGLLLKSQCSTQVGLESLA